MNKTKLKFPLRWGSEDLRVYIFDSNNAAIVQVESLKKNLSERHPFEKLVGEFKEVSVSYVGDRYFVYQGDIYDANLGERIGRFLVDDEFTYEYVINKLNS